MTLSEKVLKQGRDFDTEEVLNFIMSHGITYAGAWGLDTQNVMNFDNKALGFKVNGMVFSGLILITLNSADLFDIYYINETTRKLDKLNKDIYRIDLMRTMDKEIEGVDQGEIKYEF